MQTQRFQLVLATDGDIYEEEIADNLDALGYHGIMVMDQAKHDDHEHPCPSGACLMQLRREGHFVPVEVDCCRCWGSGTVGRRELDCEVTRRDAGQNPEMGDGEMPSEVIYGPNDVHTRVSWGNEGSETVQIVTQAVASETRSETERLITMVNEWLKMADMPVIDYKQLTAKLEIEPFFDGWWMQLDSWGQVNRLIKVLQRARNRAFGDPA